MARFLPLIAGCALGVLPFLAAAQQQQPSAGDDPVVARVNGEDIHRSAVLEFASKLPPQYQAQLVQLYPLLVQRLIDFRLAGEAGRTAGLADDAEVRRRVAEAETRAIRDVYLEREMDRRITEDALRIRYDEYLAANPPQTEQRARHILVETEEKARALIAELDAGADFAELAKANSTGPSASEGGDLGYFTADRMVPEFAAAASALAPGEYSRVPVKTQFGWHIIKVEDRRQTQPPSFEEMKSQLREDMASEVVQAVFDDLRKTAQVEVLPAGTSMLTDGAESQ
ncbi:MAG: peptidylprolyl isomerase [Alphaproteobacteria bacterium]|nr:MAG: peptidylprolyl isomerase [Alphaproteobacteria bacterium]